MTFTIICDRCGSKDVQVYIDGRRTYISCKCGNLQQK